MFDRIFGDRYLDPEQSEAGEAGRMHPCADVSEEEERYVITIDIPGMAKEEVSIKVEGGKLTIEGERKVERTGKSHRAERAYGRFLRAFTLPEGIDAGGVEAKMANGVLSVGLPKNKAAQPIEVKIS